MSHIEDEMSLIGNGSQHGTRRWVSREVMSPDGDEITQNGDEMSQIGDKMSHIGNGSQHGTRVASYPGFVAPFVIVPPVARILPPAASNFLDGVHYEAELVINDFPQHARWKITYRDTVQTVYELTGAVVTTKGRFFAPGQPVPEGESKLYLLIQGPSRQSVVSAKFEIRKFLEDCLEQAVQRQAPLLGRYSVV
eukprot:jgi/Botrbrau1/9463/Bobra.0252s0084.1